MQNENINRRVREIRSNRRGGGQENLREEKWRYRKRSKIRRNCM